MTRSAVEDGWEALRGDPLHWLLDDEDPAVRWRTLVELVGRDEHSPAVRRARGGADAVEPVATLLAPLQPDGRWDGDLPPWRRYGGAGWRLVAAVDLGADPTDPRLQAAAQRLLETSTGRGGFSTGRSAPPSPVVTARGLQMLCELGWGRHLRVQEALAWLEEEVVLAGRSALGATTAVATLRAASRVGRGALAEGAVEALLTWLDDRRVRPRSGYGLPGLAGTDELEVLWAMSGAGTPYDPRMRRALVRLQGSADADGRWRRRRALPGSLAVSGGRPGEPCRWITLRAVVTVMRYAVDAELPRLFPRPPTA